MDKYIYIKKTPLILAILCVLSTANIFYTQFIYDNSLRSSHFNWSLNERLIEVEKKIK